MLVASSHGVIISFHNLVDKRQMSSCHLLPSELFNYQCISDITDDSSHDTSFCPLFLFFSLFMDRTVDHRPACVVEIYGDCNLVESSKLAVAGFCDII